LLFSRLEDEPDVEGSNTDLLLQQSSSASAMEQDSSSLPTATDSKNNRDAEREEAPFKLPAGETESLSSDVEIISDDNQETPQGHADLLNTGFELT
jgi:hypothetical protein